MAKDRAAAGSVRPQRQRTPTTLYTDDNPSTFTVKIKKTKAQREAAARAAAEEAAQQRRQAEKRPKPPQASSLTPPNGRRHSTSPYFRKDKEPLSRRVTDTADDLSLSSRTSSSASRRLSGGAPGPNKRKRKLPTSSAGDSSLPPPPSPASARPGSSSKATSSSSSSHTPPSARAPAHHASSPTTPASPETAAHSKGSAKGKGKGKGPSSPAPAAGSLHGSPYSHLGAEGSPQAKRHTPDPSVDISEGTAIPHAVRVARALPPFQADVDKAGKADHIVQQQRLHMVNGDGLGVPTPLPAAHWTPLYSPDVYFDRDYAEPAGECDDDDSTQHAHAHATAEPANRSLHAESPRGPQSPRRHPEIQTQSPRQSPRQSHSQSPSRTAKRKHKELHPNLLPVTRTVTCMATRKPNLDYLAVGDSAGFVLIYTLGAQIRPLARLESTACQQRSFDQQERARQQRGKFSHTRVVNTGTGPDDALVGGATGSVSANGASGNIILKKKPMRRLLIDTSETTIHALGLVGTRVVLATSCELECMDIPSHTSLWVCPLMRDRLVTSLDIHTLSYDILVSCSLSLLTSSVKDDATAQEQPPVPEHPSMAMTSPLMLLTYSHNNVEICDANSPILVKSPCCTAIWDASKTAENRLLFIAPDDQELELVLVQGGTIDNWKVACKTRIPINTKHGGVPMTRLSQSEEGMFTLVASSRGIRLYQTETLQLVHTYGDNLALHGKSIVWQDCLLFGRRRYQATHSEDGSGPVSKSPQGNMLVYQDLLSASASASASTGSERKGDTSKPTEKDIFEDLGQFIVGVPHPTKGPEELCEALHVWRVDQATVVPAQSIQLPKWSNGIQSLVVSKNVNLDEDRFILTTQSGDCHMLLPKSVSDFAGHMYPVGSHLVNDNIEYIEDEDELDVTPHTGTRSSPSSPVRSQQRASSIKPEDLDDVLLEAMRQSIQDERDRERREKEETTIVNIIDSDDGDESFANIVIPCRPEAYLQQDVNRYHDDPLRAGRKSRKSDSTSGVSNFSSDFLGIMPQSKRVKKRRKSAVLRKAVKAQEQKEKEKKPATDPASSNTFFKSNRMTIATITAVPPPINPCAVVPKGRSGKRSRSANLEAMLRASIDPQLEKFMSGGRQSWSSGHGSKLPPELKAPGSAKGAPSSIKVVETKPMTVQMNVAPKISAGPVSSISTAPMQVVASQFVQNGHPTIVPNGSAVFRAPCIDPQDSLQAIENEHHPSLPTVTPQEPNAPAGAQIKSDASPALGSPPPMAAADENAVVLGLLGLSPEKAPASKDVSMNGNSHAIGQSAFEKSSVMISLGSSLDAASNADSSGINIVKVNIEKKPGVFCSACLGRHVIHACGKRELPVDVEEILRVEREKREAEEEEKRKAKAEKRRQADAKRRETRRKKQQEKEDRKRREQEKATFEAERQDRLMQAEAQLQAAANMEPPPNRFGGYMSSNRFGSSLPSPPSELVPVSYFDRSRPPGHHFEQHYSSDPAQAQAQPSYSTQATSPGWPETCAPLDTSPAAHSYHGGGYSRLTEPPPQSVEVADQESRYPPAQYSKPAEKPKPVSVTVGTLSSAEGLAALASIAESTSSGFSFSGSRFTSPQPISFDEAMNSHLDEEKKSATSSHGFGESPQNGNSEANRAIPSYASMNSGRTEAGAAGQSSKAYWQAPSNGYNNMLPPETPKGVGLTSSRVASHHRP